MQVPTNLFNLLGFNPTGDLGALTAYFSQRHKIVWFPKAPPLNPPSPMQESMRDFFRQVALLWRLMTPEERRNWQLAADRSRCSITGYNLFLSYQRTKDDAGLRTIERQSGITLRPTD